MKGYLDFVLTHKRNVSETPASALHHVFAILGSGNCLDNKGFFPSNYRNDELYQFPEPEPFNYIYPWSDTERFQPFRKMAGCRDVGFKEAAQYFIDCVKLTPDSVENAKQWKDNIHIVEDVLLNTPTITDEYSDIKEGYQQFLSKLLNAPVTDNHGGLSEEVPDSVTKRWFFDVQWSNCPQFVENEVRQMWRSRELGNDNYIYKTQLNNDLFAEYPNVYYWLKHSGVSEGEKVIIHWWW